jgi:hypothetical protein
LGRERLEERKMEEVDVEMQHVELVAPFVQLVQHREMRREVGVERAGIEPDRLVAHGHERGPGPRLGAREQGHLVASSTRASVKWATIRSVPP